VPQDHLLRQIDRFLDLSDLREHLAPFYSHTGRPSIDPELMIRYRAEQRDCQACAFKEQCCPNTGRRTVPRNIHESDESKC